MIQNDQELQAALEWIEYWKSTRTTGQSWLGNEQAALKIAEYRRAIDIYRHGLASLSPAEAAIVEQPT